jgi:hypothetical protein
MILASCHVGGTQKPLTSRRQGYGGPPELARERGSAASEGGARWGLLSNVSAFSALIVVKTKNQ